MTTRLMAAINVSPESFYKGSVPAGMDALAEMVQRCEADGAAMIDIGAMSTAPYKETQITEAEELRRMVTAIRAARAVTSLPISADTQRAAVANAALESGATVINDVTALLADPAMGPLCATHGAQVILMANDDPALDERGEPPARVVERLLREAVDRALQAGIARSRLLVDPGIGFFRHRSVPWHAWDLAVLRDLERLQSLGLPLVVGASRKSFIGELLGRKNPADRLAGSLAVAAWCALRGVEWHRVHDVAETRDAVRMAEMLANG